MFLSNKNKHPNRVLRTNIELHTAMLERRRVSVYIGSELMGVGLIEEIDEESVKINGEWYMRATCTFVMK